MISSIRSVFRVRRAACASATRARTAGGRQLLITLLLAGTASAATGATLPNTLGEQQTAVLLVNFQDDPANQPFSTQYAHDVVFGQVDDFVQENSGGRTWLAGDVYGWLTLSMDTPSDPNSDCKHSLISSRAHAAAANAGIDLAPYARFIYVFPQTSCFVSAAGSTGGVPSESWINGDWFQLKTVAHELGHNFGLLHSTALECGPQTLGGDCQIFTYGDTLDVMGSANLAHFNAYQKERLGWLSPETGQLAVIAADGNFQVGVYETPPGSLPQALKVAASPDPVSGAARWFYIEYRQPIGHDAFLTGYPNVTNGLVIHLKAEPDDDGALLDMTPESSATWDWGDPALEFGNSFTDAASGLTIDAMGGDGSTANVALTFDSPACVRADPLLTVSTTGTGVAPGTPVIYDGSITNADSSACGSSTFSLQTSLPGTWSVSFSDQSPTLAPGDATTFQLTVASPANQTSGTVAFEISAQTADHLAVADAQYVVDVEAQPANSAPLAADDQIAIAARSTLIVDVLANDSDPDGDVLTITGVTSFTNGSVTINPDNTLTIETNRRFKRQSSFTYTISDGEESAQGTVTVNVEQSSGGGDGGGGSTGGGGNGKGKNK